MSDHTETPLDTSSDPDDYIDDVPSESSSLTGTESSELSKTISTSAESGVGSMTTKSSKFSLGSKFREERVIYAPTTTILHHPHTKGRMFRILGGFLIMFLSVVTLAYTPFEFLMNERLKMVPGLPAYDLWVTPPDEVLLKVYLFNITNGEAFITGEEDVLRMEEVGPYVFREKLFHSDIVFNDNGTLSYTATRSAVFLPELNTLSLDDPITVPNLAVLGTASHLSSSSFLLKMGFNMIVQRAHSAPLRTVTVDQYLWNWSDPIVDIAGRIVPSMVPVNNFGMLHLVYEDFVDRLNVFIGTEDPRRFFLIDKYRGSHGAGWWDGACDDCRGSTEGVTYPQFLTRNDSIHYFRKTICRVAVLHYSHDVNQLGMEAYRWELPHNTYHRPPNGTEDCYTRKGEKPLPSGISDISPCFYSYPVAISLPHFLGATTNVSPRLHGMNPDNEKHGSYVIIEPTTGIPMQSRARSQSNLVVKKLSGFSTNVTRFSEMVLPIVWLEYGQQGLPWYISYLMYFTVVILPLTQHWFSLAMLLGGFALFLSGALPYIRIVGRKYALKYYKFEKISLGYFR